MIWGGDPLCEHVWGSDIKMDKRGLQTTSLGIQGQQRSDARESSNGQFCQRCKAWKGSLGLEPDLDFFIQHLVEIFREARRVLHPSGVLLVNMGDSYASSPPGNKTPRSMRSNAGIFNMPSQVALDARERGSTLSSGLKPKDLMGVPWRLALALQNDGWWLRSDLIWVKSLDRSEQELKAQQQIEEALSIVRAEAEGSLFGLTKKTDQALKRAEKAVERLCMVGASMPGSQKDRCTMSHEYLFMFSKNRQYYWDRHAIRVPHLKSSLTRWEKGGEDTNNTKFEKEKPNTAVGNLRNASNPLLEGGRNARSVWRVAVESHRPFLLPSGEEIAHFASFPRALPARAIRAGTSQHGVCAECGAPFERIIKPTPEYAKLLGRDWADYAKDAEEGRGHSVSNQRTTKRGPATTASYETVGWEPTCRCFGEPVKGDVVCKKCRGTGREKTDRTDDTETAYDGQMTAGRLAKLRQAARKAGSEYDSAFAGLETGKPCSSCLCPACDGTGKEIKYQRGQQSWANGASLGYPQRDNKGGLTNTPKIETGEPCPTCKGMGALGVIAGDVWSDEIIKAWSITPATVLDMFAGTGQTLLAGLDLGRDVIGIDLSDKYCRLSRARCEAWPEALPEKKSKNAKVVV